MAEYPRCYTSQYEKDGKSFPIFTIVFFEKEGVPKKKGNNLSMGTKKVQTLLKHWRQINQFVTYLERFGTLPEDGAEGVEYGEYKGFKTMKVITYKSPKKDYPDGINMGAKKWATVLSFKDQMIDFLESNGEAVPEEVKGSGASEVVEGEVVGDEDIPF